MAEFRNPFRFVTRSRYRDVERPDSLSEVLTEEAIPLVDAVLIRGVIDAAQSAQLALVHGTDMRGIWRCMSLLSSRIDRTCETFTKEGCPVEACG
jgi:hypothetical protein